MLSVELSINGSIINIIIQLGVSARDAVLGSFFLNVWIGAPSAVRAAAIARPAHVLFPPPFLPYDAQRLVRDVHNRLLQLMM